jgi:hypothetical protein
MNNNCVADEVSDLTMLITDANQLQKELKLISKKLTYQLLKIKIEKANQLSAPSAYTIFMKGKMIELEESHPSLTKIERMKMAVEAWYEKTEKK